MSNESVTTTLPGGVSRVAFQPATPASDEGLREGSPAERGAPSGGSWNSYTGESKTHEVVRTSTADLVNGHVGILATAKDPRTGRPALTITEDCIVTIDGLPMKIATAIQAGLMTRSQAGIYGEAPVAPAPQPARVDPVDASLANLEARLGPSMATRITEEVLRKGSLDAIDPTTYAYAGMTKEEFDSIAGPVFARTTARIEDACGGPGLADVIYGWCERDSERSREYNAAVREAHHTGDTSRLQAIAQAFHRA